MKLISLTIVLGMITICNAQQKASLPKNISDDWVLIPALEFTSGAVSGNDSFNFDNGDRIIRNDEFYVYKNEISNKLYREFVSATKDNRLLPDTNSWNTDFKLAYNDPMRIQYYSHPKYEDYPVIGVSQIQAMAYCKWLETSLNSQLEKSGKLKDFLIKVSLPTDDQWQGVFYYSYQLGEKYADAPGYLLRTKIVKTGENYNVNYGQEYTREGFVTKDYMSDGGLYQTSNHNFKSNKRGIYNLAGNIAEWTISPAYNTADSIKVSIDRYRQEITIYTKKKGKESIDTSKSIYYTGSMDNLKSVHKSDGYFAVKGGSWVHGIFYLQPTVSLYCKPQEQHCYIGFRPVLTLLKKNNVLVPYFLNSK